MGLTRLRDRIQTVEARTEASNRQRAERDDAKEGNTDGEADAHVVRAVVIDTELLPDQHAEDAERTKQCAKESPAGSSRMATRHQSLIVTSRRASARMISDVACDPEFLPN